MLELKSISFSYGEKQILKDISFSLKQGEYLAVVGPSGCGKSTLLELIYGLLAPSHGEIFHREVKLLGPEFYLVPGEPFMKYLPQDFDLMPYISVAENVGKYLSNQDPKKKERRIRELLDVVEMGSYFNSKVKHLSGGQKQRVALARVLAKEPEILLLDEPFSHIDNFKKNSLRRSLFRYLKEQKVSCLVATHDTTDALSFADRTMVIDDCKIIANDIPSALYHRPKTKYIASFFGDVNQISGELVDLDTRQDYLLYPNELRLSESGIQVEVIASYLKEGQFLIESKMDTEIIYFMSDTSLDVSSRHFIRPSGNYWKNRIVSKA
jgi:ABC-type Fe3+/spermidine/putrescine transport system ATPase subunit